MAKRKSSKNSSAGCSSEIETVPAKMSKPSLPFNWQSTKSKLTEKLGLIVNTEHYADIHFIVGREKRKIPAHKFVLLVGSPVFDAYFSGRWTAEKEIEVEDVEPDIFLALLEFLYTDATVVTADSVMAVWYAARKYEVPSLEDVCTDFLMRNLDSLNAFTVLNQAKLFDKTSVVNTCEQFIDENAGEVFKTDELIKIDLSTLVSILKRDTLRIEEFDLLRASLRWADAECNRKQLTINSENRRSVLKGALNAIRFPLMSTDQFTSEVAETKLLPDEELVPLLLYFLNKKSLPSHYNAIPRPMPYFVLNRFPDVSDSVYSCNGKKKTLIFKAGHDLQLMGIGMFCSTKGAADYVVKLTIKLDMVDKPSRKVIMTSWDCASTSCPVNEAKSTFRLFLPNPVKLLKNGWYYFNFSIEGPDSFCGKNGKAQTFIDVPNANNEKVKIEYVSVYKEEDTHLMGQLPELLFTS